MNLPLHLIRQGFRSSGRLSANRARSSHRPLEFQKLEARVLLAGDVTVFVDNNFALNVIGDDADNQVLIIGERLSGARVVGLDGTTINGGSGEFASFYLQGLTVQMGGGNDSIDLHDARFSFAPLLAGEAGNDSIVVRDSSLKGLNLQAGNGDDVVEIKDVFSVGTSSIQTGSGDDTIAIYNHASTQDIFIRAGAGNDTVAIDRIGMFQKLELHMEGGDDQVLIAGETWLGQGSLLSLGQGNDFLGILPDRNSGHANLQPGTIVHGGAGNDAVALDASVSSGSGSELNGALGDDSFHDEGASLIETSLLGFENRGFDYTSALDAVYRQLAEVGLDPTLFGGSADFILGIDINTIPLSYTENAPPISLDAFLELSGSSDTQVTSASVTIDGFVANQDILEFSNVGSVTGVFDDATGILVFTGNGNLTQYQTALRSVRYRNSSESPSQAPRSLDIELITSDSATKASRSLNVFAVNDIPELDVRDTELLLDIDDPQLVRPAVLDGNVTLNDVDTPTFSSATVQIVSGGQPGDVLGFQDMDGITGNYDAATGLLTLTGTATTEQYEKALRSITFDNLEDRAPLGRRVIRFETTDGQTLVADQFNLEIVASQTINVIASSAALTYTETDLATVIDNTLVVDTPNDANAIIDGATVSIISGLDSTQDSLTFEAQSGIDGVYDSDTGVLTFTGAASVENYQKLLQSVQFFNSSFGDFDFSTADRVVEFAVTRSGLTARDTRTIVMSEIGSEQELIQRYLEVNNMTAQVTASGLNYVVTREGDGNFPNENSTVTVNYVGTLLNGEEFDSGESVTFSLQQVIEGWTEGIPLFSTGGAGILLIPSALGYGAFPPPNSGIPANAILMFEVELLSFV